MTTHWTLVNSETKDLTRELAQEFSQRAPSPTERELLPARMSYLKDTVLGGRAILFNWSQVKIAGTTEVIRVNGQHSSNMLATLDGEFPEGLKVNISTYEVDNKASLGLLFRQFDNRNSSRSVDDISGAYQGIQPDLINVPRKAARMAVDGAAWYLRRVVGDPIPRGDDRFDLFSNQDLHPFIQLVGRICSAKTPEFSTPVIGAMYGTFEREPSMSEVFWTDVAKQGAGNNSNHPTVALDGWLLEVNAKDRKGDKPTEWEVYRACVLAWNAYRNNRTLDKIGKYDPKKGTPDLD